MDTGVWYGSYPRIWEWAGSRLQFHSERVFPTRFILAEILILVGDVIPLAPAVPASTRISDRMKCDQEHVSRVNVHLVWARAVVRGRQRVVPLDELPATTQDGWMDGWMLANHAKNQIADTQCHALF